MIFGTHEFTPPFGHAVAVAATSLTLHPKIPQTTCGYEFIPMVFNWFPSIKAFIFVYVALNCTMQLPESRSRMLKGVLIGGHGGGSGGFGEGGGGGLGRGGGGGGGRASPGGGERKGQFGTAWVLGYTAARVGGTVVPPI